MQLGAGGCAGAGLVRLGACATAGEDPHRLDGAGRELADHPLRTSANLKFKGKSYDIELIHFQGTPLMITALQANEVDIALLAYSSLALAIQNAGMEDLRVIADEAQEGVDGYYTSPFMVRKDAGINKVEHMKGKVAATVGAGAAVDIAMRAMLKKHGLEDKRDYTVVEAAFPEHARAAGRQEGRPCLGGAAVFDRSAAVSKSASRCSR